MESYNGLLLMISLILMIIICFQELSQGQILPIVNEVGTNTFDPNPVYIVHVKRPKGAHLLSNQQLRDWHETFLPNRTLDSGEPRLLYSYRHAIDGFAARLTPDEARDIESTDGIVLARRSQRHPLATTYTPEFLGLSQFDGAWTQSKYKGQGLTIGVVDTGITNDHPSFDDKDMPSPPPHWNGTCIKGSNIICNRKIIGAYGFINGSTALDLEGHGTHVSSIAAGSPVDGANVLGMARGTAYGMAPLAHIAMYRACIPVIGCEGYSILAGIEQAISDKADIVTVSIGSESREFDKDDVVLASMGALLKGITPVVCAGNDGPSVQTLDHVAPWTLVVGASTTDRRIRATVELEGGKELHGETAFQPDSWDSNRLLQLKYPGEFGNEKAKYCLNGSLENYYVEKKIVICNAGVISDVDKGKEVLRKGGAGMIVITSPALGYTVSVSPHWIPASTLSNADSRELLSFYDASVNTLNGARARIKFKGTVFDYRPAPALAAFSSRGPAPESGGLLKPDVLAPGVNVVGAWYEEVGPNKTGTLKKNYNFASGTSMSTPHVAGIVALVKSKYPKWAPSAIQSAIITSANSFDLDGNDIVDENYNGRAHIFGVGAGQVNASSALNPGLVYYTNPDDYVGYICGLGTYNDSRASLIAKKEVECSKVQKITASELNYPSIALYLTAQTQEVTVTRTVTNVGEATSTYRARIVEPLGLTVSLSDYELKFSRKDQEISFSVTFKVRPGRGSTDVYTDGRLEWVSDKHVVKSPIAVWWP